MKKFSRVFTGIIALSVLIDVVDAVAMKIGCLLPHPFKWVSIPVALIGYAAVIALTYIVIDRASDIVIDDLTSWKPGHVTPPELLELTILNAVACWFAGL